MNHRHQVFIHNVEEEVLVCTLQEHNPLEQLKNEIFTKTGIKPSVQRLMHQQKFITSDQALLKLGPDCNLFLTVALRGGSGECDVCFSKGEFTCAECENRIRSVVSVFTSILGGHSISHHLYKYNPCSKHTARYDH